MDPWTDRGAAAAEAQETSRRPNASIVARRRRRHRRRHVALRRDPVIQSYGTRGSQDLVSRSADRIKSIYETWGPVERSPGREVWDKFRFLVFWRDPFSIT